MSKQMQGQALAIASRVVAAIVGGYVLANLAAILLSHLLPMPQPDAVMTTMLGSFALYTGAVMWVFTTETATKAWIGLVVPCLMCAAWVFVLLPETPL